MSTICELSELPYVQPVQIAEMNLLSNGMGYSVGLGAVVVVLAVEPSFPARITARTNTAGLLA